MCCWGHAAVLLTTFRWKHALITYVINNIVSLKNKYDGYCWDGTTVKAEQWVMRKEHSSATTETVSMMVNVKRYGQLWLRKATLNFDFSETFDRWEARVYSGLRYRFVASTKRHAHWSCTYQGDINSKIKKDSRSLRQREMELRRTLSNTQCRCISHQDNVRAKTMAKIVYQTLLSKPCPNICGILNRLRYLLRPKLMTREIKQKCHSDIIRQYPHHFARSYAGEAMFYGAWLLTAKTHIWSMHVHECCNFKSSYSQMEECSKCDDKEGRCQTKN